MNIVFSHYNYWVVIFLMMVGFYILISRGNLIKKIVGLNVFQTSVFMLYISIGKVTGAEVPIVPVGGAAEGGHGDEGGEGHAEGEGGEAAAEAGEAAAEAGEAVAEAGEAAAEAGHAVAEAGHAAAEVLYANPLPQVLILTAIVVGIATTSVGLALAVRIKEAYGTLEEDEINRIEAGAAPAGNAPPA